MVTHPFYDYREELAEADTLPTVYRSCAPSAFEEEGMDYVPQGWSRSVQQQLDLLSRPSVGTVTWDGETYDASLKVTFDEDSLVFGVGSSCQEQGYGQVKIVLDADPVTSLSITTSLDMRQLSNTSQTVVATNGVNYEPSLFSGMLPEHPWVTRKISAVFWVDGGLSMNAKGWSSRFIWGRWRECLLDINTDFVD